MPQSHIPIPTVYYWYAHNFYALCFTGPPRPLMEPGEIITPVSVVKVGHICLFNTKYISHISCRYHVPISMKCASILALMLA